MAIIRKYDLVGKNNENNIDDYSDSPNISTLSQYKQAAISYIAGYVEKKVKESTCCTECGMALGSVSGEASSSFLVLKDHGNLFKPTSSVIKVCEETERCFQRMLAVTEGQLPNACGISEAIVPVVLGSLSIPSLFKELGHHLFNSPVGDNHVVQLIKSIIKSFCNTDALSSVYEISTPANFNNLALIRSTPEDLICLHLSYCFHQFMCPDISEAKCIRNGWHKVHRIRVNVGHIVSKFCSYCREIIIE